MRHIKEKKHCVCVLCGWQWDSRVPSPKACPKCKRYDWNKVDKVDEEEKVDGFVYPSFKDEVYLEDLG